MRNSLRILEKWSQYLPLIGMLPANRDTTHASYKPILSQRLIPSVIGYIAYQDLVSTWMVTTAITGDYTLFPRALLQIKDIF